MIQAAIGRLIAGESLDRDEARGVMEQIMSGDATDAQIGGFLMALRAKGETIDEIAGFAETMRAKATQITGGKAPLVDTCGTGGDASGTFNISTTVAFVAAGAGLTVAKHGNRAMSSRCGSADVLAQLGVNVEATPDQVGHCLDEAGIGFLFAPALHGAMKHAIGPRKELGTRTVFNVLGPLTNPAGAKRQLIGVFAPDLTETMAGVLGALGSERAFVVHGHDGLDELTLTGPSRVTELADGATKTYDVTPEDFGLQRVSVDQLAGGDAAQNAAILTSILDGELGPAADVVVMNAAAAIVAGGVSQDLASGVKVARDSIEFGKARASLDRLRDVSNA
ncbi:MAG TPA: anthranilate phosphoribosyltransferase [Candidatus Latescibacteria bacterium]|jgi:anthranilate phosphoribosyltransferase|nr:anthranilate phosphoribosyltransferase [Gemmatimonadota bacterium]MDP7362007.1 anthranilate phosphoribosyltransferase [Candidatus Latescibacterota bacterium]MDP7632600.1 anthranilate phosphoribosyltransferase [Candidatus Latescibacterota bacterium]MEE3040582.1 anthranilate phosphoribosyltransferase [Candidatus Latescibacterota bacterium]HCV21847.1 anthranilate phosphoribosyltransferase [Candidatus Latescibacterota bacterium]